MSVPVAGTDELEGSPFQDLAAVVASGAKVRNVQKAGFSFNWFGHFLIPMPAVCHGQIGQGHSDTL